MIEVDALVKRYGSRTAVDSISFSVGKPGILGFLGPNGAGKSTTMNMLAGCISPSSGTIRIGGLDPSEEPARTRSMVGYLPEKPPLYDELTVIEYLDFVASLKKVPGSMRKAFCTEAMERTGLESIRSRLIRNLSKGYRQRVGIAQALVAKPEILILDEPTSGLDPAQIQEIRNLIASLGENRTILLSSHILPEVSALCPRILILDRGKIVMDGSPEDVSTRLQGKNRLIIRVRSTENRVAEILESRMHPSGPILTFKTLGALEPETVDFLVESAPCEDIRETVFTLFAENSLPLSGMRPESMSLEDIFMKLTHPESRAV